VAAEASQVAGLTAVAGLVLRSLLPTLGISTMHSLAFVESATAAGASVVALLSVVVARMTRDRRLLMAGRAWAFFGLVVMPLTSVSDSGSAPGPWSAASAASTAVFLALFAHATWDYPVRWSHRRRLASAGTLGLALAVLAAVQVPVATLGRVAVDSADLTFVVGWALLAGRCVTRGMRRGEPVWWRSGFALGIVAAGQLVSVLDAADPAQGRTILHFPALRMLGLLALAAGLTRYTRRLVRDRRDREAERAEEAALAAHAQAQRSHEIRNVVSNLSAITALLAPSGSDLPQRAVSFDMNVAVADPGSIKEIVSSEFARLHSLLESSSAGHESAGAPVDRVLTRLVTLRRLTGSVITLRCPPGLLAALPAATLAQVVTNLLANCARHAPGAEIHVSARANDGICVIEVTDAGPGLLALQGETATTGSGLGLELSSRLIGDFGGTLQLMPAERFPSGTTARLCLPMVDGVDAGYPTDANDRSADLQMAR
jgi:two-component system OmpR family sensor kinase